MSGPASIFLTCWPDVNNAMPGQRTSAPRCLPSVRKAIVNALEHIEADKAELALQMLLDAGRRQSPDVFLGIQLEVMECIDREFGRIHPRSFDSSDRRMLPEWLQTARERRRQTGIYEETYEEEHDPSDIKIREELAQGIEPRTKNPNKRLKLLPRGPLLRSQRDEHASYADSVSDRFAYLAVLGSHINLEETPIEITFLPVIDEEAMRGVIAGSEIPGRERVCAIPVAEKIEDLSLKTSIRSQKRYVEIGPAPEFRPDEVLLAALYRHETVDIALAPEFVMTLDAQNQVLTKLQEGAGPCRLLLAGTANICGDDGAQPWNEALVSNHFGVVLWRQRKIWPSQLDPARAKAYGIDINVGEGPFHEDTASGSRIKVIDIDTIGRCVILICQDFESDLAYKLLRVVQPDWVFVPIMDRGFAVKTWFADRARELSKISQARLVGVCSTALPRTDGQAISTLNIFCAARGESGPGEDSVPWCATAFVSSEGTPGRAVHHFGADHWLRIMNMVEPITR